MHFEYITETNVVCVTSRTSKLIIQSQINQNFYTYPILYHHSIKHVDIATVDISTIINYTVLMDIKKIEDFSPIVIHLLERALLSSRRLAEQSLQGNKEITLTQFTILYSINNLSSASQQTIANFLCMDKAAVSRHLDILEKKNWVKRQRDETSRREYRIHITSLGSEVYERTYGILCATFVPRYQAMSDHERHELLVVLNKLNQILSNPKQETENE